MPLVGEEQLANKFSAWISGQIFKQHISDLKVSASSSSQPASGVSDALLSGALLDEAWLSWDTGSFETPPQQILRLLTSSDF